MIKGILYLEGIFSEGILCPEGILGEGILYPEGILSEGILYPEGIQKYEKLIRQDFVRRDFEIEPFS